MTIQLLYQLIAGYDSDVATNTLARDPLCTLLNDQAFASQPSLSRFWDRFTPDTIDDFSEIIQQLFHHVVTQLNREVLIFDIDSTHIDTFDKQEDTD